MTFMNCLLAFFDFGVAGEEATGDFRNGIFLETSQHLYISLVADICLNLS